MLDERERATRAVGHTYCNVCKFEFGNSGYLWLHVKNVHGAHQYARCAGIPPGAKRYQSSALCKRSGAGILKDPARREKMRVVLLKRDGRHCIWCGDRMEWPEPASGHNPRSMTFEHIKRRREGGGNNRENLALACWQCNHERA